MIDVPVSNVRRAAFHRFGGKWNMAKWIISHLPEHRFYIEPFAGAASVLLRKLPCESEVLNDVDDEVVNIFRVMRDPVQAKQLEHACYWTPSSRTELRLALERSDDPVEQARRTIYRNFVALTPNASTDDIKITMDAGGGRRPRSWASYSQYIDGIRRRLQNVVIENRPALELIQRFDDPDLLYYLDPPYVAKTRLSTRTYAHEMSDDDHRELAETVKGLKAMVAISGYQSELYTELYGDWTLRTRQTRATFASKHRPEEALWLNGTAMKKHTQGELF